MNMQHNRHIIPRVVVEPRRGIMRTLTRAEIQRLQRTGETGMHDLLRRCIVAVLNTGTAMDNADVVLAHFEGFELKILVGSGGVALELMNIPFNENVFVDGEINEGTKEQLFSVLRDIVFFQAELDETGAFDLLSADGITDTVFAVFRNANLIDLDREPALVINWGGHSITRDEYEYTKMVGYHLGLRGMDIGTGCGPGAMKGPMKGAALGHLKQRVHDGMYLGITEPGIIAAESPNPAVNQLVIFPDIEKRLEAFVRRGHGIIVYPGGAGTAEEILYLLGILMDPRNKELNFPVIFTASSAYASYFEMIDRFIVNTLGADVRRFYKIILDDQALVARTMRDGIREIMEYRLANGDHPHFNRLLTIPEEFQQPFVPSHENVRSLDLSADQPKHLLAANLRRLFSAIVAGNVKADGIRRVAEYGPYEIVAPKKLMNELDTLLTAFVAQGRMKINAESYKPCYRLVAD